MPLPSYPYGDVFSPPPRVLTDISRARVRQESRRSIWLDFETHYGTKYSLRSQDLNYYDYIRDARFRELCLCARTDTGNKVRLTGKDIQEFIRVYPWEEATVYAHNCMFDGLILAERYNVRPARWRCTLSLARALFQGSIPADIDSLADLLGLPGKSGILEEAKNKYWEDLSPEQQEKMLSYCENDVDVSWAFTETFGPSLPDTEWALMERTLQQFLEPLIYVDTPRLQRELERVQNERAELIAITGVQARGKKSAEKRFSSLKEFNELVTTAGGTLPTKWSEKQEKDVVACSKTDLEWLRLVETWRQNQQTELVNLANARMNCASSTHITRPARLLKAAEGNRPVGAAYNYYGAHTGRWSGANKLNFQNFKRKGEIRKSLVAPKGFVFVVVDASQIELRFNAWLHNEDAILLPLRQGICIYRRTAGLIYNLPEAVYLALASDSPERFIGKVTQLGLGYGMSGPKFNDTLALGSQGPAVFMSQEQTNHIVYDIYRPHHRNIVNGWRMLDVELAYMMDRSNKRDYKCLEFRHNKVILPNGMAQQYGNLHFVDERSKSYWADGAWHNIYGGLFDENLVQALARIPIGDALLTVNKEFPVVMDTHDELVALVPENQADDALTFMIETISTAPSWAPDIPLKAEGGYDYCYSK